MPWDAAEVHLADLDAAGDATTDRHVAGSRDGSAGNPQWAADGTLHLVVDRAGWWNLHVLDPDGRVRVLVPEDAEHGGPTPGPGSYDVDDQHVVLACRTPAGCRLEVVDRAGGAPRVLDLPLTDVSSPRLSRGRVVFLGGSATTPLAVWSVPVDGGEPVLVRGAGGGELDPALLAEPESLTAASRDGQPVHGYYYPPRPAVDGPVPLLVGVHGGPVGRVSTALQFGMYAPAAAVYWTSRGYGYLEMAYRGTTGYGRAYREALYGRWGELEVDDVLDVVQHLVDRGDVDPARVGIRGGSAGGWTVLAAATRAPGAFAAGTAYFPVSDLVSFHSSTHKFESRYDESLIGPYDEAVYRERSPLTRVDVVRTPLLFLQGEDDRVCPPEQSELFVDALRALGRPVEYRLFPGEGHGFVRAETIVESLEREEAFYAEHLAGAPAAARD
jgi:dipeptidyl aminopeptidase/acylaminoacyl peptidase